LTTQGETILRSKIKGQGQWEDENNIGFLKYVYWQTCCRNALAKTSTWL